MVSDEPLPPLARSALQPLPLSLSLTCVAGYLYHQKDMLQDQGRMDGYRNAILMNARSFAGKVVLDVGTGSGILAIWAAKAGAKKVYAVEATSMSQHARRLVAQNNLQDVVVVLEGYMEKLDIPEKVDIIVSEWMGYFLLREAMLDSVLYARDTYLKPGGAMYPSHAQIIMAPLCANLHTQRAGEYADELGAWADFSEYMRASNGVEIGGLAEYYDREQFEYLLQTAHWCQLSQAEIIGDEFNLCEMDVHDVTVPQLSDVRCDFRSEIVAETELTAFGGWFDVQFKGSAAAPAGTPVPLSTAPGAPTHWAQQVFLVHPPLSVMEGDVVEGSVRLCRQKVNHRLLYVQVRFTLLRGGAPVEPERTCNYRID